MVVKTFMDTDQDSEEEEEEEELYRRLALHLASDFFLKHPDKDVKLQVACCLVDVFRIYTPKAPYTSPDKLKDIFMFITWQLRGLEDTKNAQFNRYFYLLENIAWVKSYNICFELEDSNEIFIQLYKTLFQVINNGHNQKVHIRMVDLMSAIICEGDTVSQDLLDTVLVNLVPAHKNIKRQAYNLAKALLTRTAQAVQPYITNFCTQALTLGKAFVSDLSEHIFDLILELYNINGHLLLSVLPQLEFKLKSSDRVERLQVVKLLTKMFGAKDSELVTQNKPLWQCFLGRFNDIHVSIRLECVHFASHCLISHPDLARDLTDYLRVRSRDPEEVIRHDVIVSIVTAAKKDLGFVSDHLLNLVRERTLDKRWRVRKAAVMGLAQIYKKYSLQKRAGTEAMKQISWIKDKLLHVYYQKSMDDRLLVERVFAQYMVPHSLEAKERMRCLYYLYAKLDVNAVKALNEMWKCQNILQHHVKDLLDLVNEPQSEACRKAVFSKAVVITRSLPDAGRAQDFVKKLAKLLEEDNVIWKQLETLVSQSCSCKQAAGCVRDITKNLGSSKQPDNPFLEMVKFLLERIAPVHIDAEAISALIKWVNKSMDGTADDEDEGVPAEQAVRAGLELLKVLSFTRPVSFHSTETFDFLLSCLKMDDPKVVEAALKILRNTGARIEESFPHIKRVLLPILQQKAKKGLPREAKYAVHCIHTFSDRDAEFAQIFEPLHKGLDAGNPHELITPLTTLGHLAMLAPEQFASPLKSLVANFVVKELLMNDRIPGKKTTKLWVSDDEVSPETLAKIQGIKLMVRWLLGVKNNQSKLAGFTLKILTAILNSKGDLTEQGRIGQPGMSRLRLAVGCAVLRLAQEPRYHEVITLEQYQLCALVISDQCYQVRQAFTQKLHRGLCRLRLPLEYMAMLSLCAKDAVKEHRAQARQSLLQNISIRRQYLKQHAALGDKLFYLLPEYMVPYAIHLLAHHPDYITAQDVEQLRDIRECLWFVFEILMEKTENNNDAFIWKMLEDIKKAKDGQAPDDPKMNEKLYAVCDVAMRIIVSKSSTYSLEPPREPVLPPRNFTQPNKPKVVGILGAVNKTLSNTRKQPCARSPWKETGSKNSSTPISPGWHRTRADSFGMRRTQYKDVSSVKTSPDPGRKSKLSDHSLLLRVGSRPRGRKRGMAPEEEVEDLGQASKPKCGRGKVVISRVTDSEAQATLVGPEQEEEQKSSSMRGRRIQTPRAASLGCGTPGRRDHKMASSPTVKEEDEEGMEGKPKAWKQARTLQRSEQKAEAFEATGDSEAAQQRRKEKAPQVNTTADAGLA